MYAYRLEADPARYGLVNGFWFTTGRVIAPSELSVGSHSLATELRDATGNIPIASNVTFVIDPGVGACVRSSHCAIPKARARRGG